MPSRVAASLGTKQPGSHVREELATKSMGLGMNRWILSTRPLTGYVTFGRLLFGTSAKMGFGPRPRVTQGWVCLGLSYNLGLPSSLAPVSHGLNIPLLPWGPRQQSRARYSSGRVVFVVA